MTYKKASSRKRQMRRATRALGATLPPSLMRDWRMTPSPVRWGPGTRQQRFCACGVLWTPETTDLVFIGLRCPACASRYIR